MSDGPSRFDPERDFLQKPEFKIKESTSVQAEAGDGSTSSALANISGPAATPASSLAARESLGRLNIPSIPSIPSAPRYSGLPYPVTLLLVAGCIVSLCCWIEPMRGLVVTTILDTKGSQAADFLDAHINYADVLYHYGAHYRAVDSLKSALAKVAASGNVDKVQQVSLLLRLAMSQYDAKQKDDARQTVAQALAMLNKKTIPTVPISVCWQLDALANTIEREEDDGSSMRPVAIQLWRKATEYFRDPNPVLVSNFYSGMAYAQMRQKEYAAAAANFMEFIRFSEIRGDRLWRAERYRQAAYCYTCIDKYDLAREAATKAMEMCLRLGPSARRELAYSQYHLGQAESHLGMQKSGIKHLNDSLAELKKYYPDEACYTYALWYLANCYRDIGDHTQAEKLYSECMAESRNTGSGPDIEVVRKDLEKNK